MENRSIGLESEQIVAAARHDALGNLGLGSHGVDSDQRALQLQPLQKRGNGVDFVGLFLDRLLTQDQALPRGPGADHVQRRAALGAGVGAPRGLAVDRHDVGFVLTQTFHPARKCSS